MVWQVLLRCVTSQKRTSISRECLQLRPPMTTPWPLVELVALPLHLRLDRFEHLINFTLSLSSSVACFQSFVLRCTLACLERRELLLLPPHILHHRCARELLCCCASFYFFCYLSASNYLFLWRRKTSMISFVPQQPQAPVQVVTQVKAEALVGPKTIKAPRQKFFLNNCFP